MNDQPVHHVRTFETVAACGMNAVAAHPTKITTRWKSTTCTGCLAHRPNGHRTTTTKGRS